MLDPYQLEKKVSVFIFIFYGVNKTSLDFEFYWEKMIALNHKNEVHPIVHKKVR